MRQFSDGVEWIYACSCDFNASQLTKTLNTHINCDYSQYTEELPECIHIMVVKRISSTIDAIHNLSPSADFSGIVEVCDNVFYLYVLSKITATFQITLKTRRLYVFYTLVLDVCIVFS